MANPPSAFDLVDQGLFRDAARTIDELPAPPEDVLVLRARLESIIGSPVRARDAARGLLRNPLRARERAVCWEVISRTALSVGQIHDGLRAMKRAFDDCGTVEDPRFEARLLASHTESLLHCVGIEPAALELPKLRQAATRAGDAYSFVESHTINAEINARRGLLAGAASSIDSASALLQQFPNVAQQGRLEVIASALAVAHSDFQAALMHAERGLDLVTTSGIQSMRLAALNNIVYLKAIERKFDEARHVMSEVLRSDPTSNPIEIFLLDTELMLALAADDLESASRVASHVSRLIATQENRSTYYELWSLPNLIRWLYRMGNFDAGVTQARQGLRRLEASSDRALVARLKLLDAEGMARKGNLEDATSLWIEAVHSDRDPPLGFVAEGLRVAGRIAASSDSRAAMLYFSQANRILSGVGNLAARSDVERDAKETLPEAIQDCDCDTLPPVISDADPLARCADRLSAFLELGAHIPTLASESAALISDAGVVYRCSAIAVNPNGRIDTLSTYSAEDRPTTIDNRLDLRIEIGVYRKTRFEVHCTPRPTGAHRFTLVSLERLIRTASVVAESRQRAREKAAEWSETPPETQLGLICASEKMTDLIKTIRRVAATSVTVLLTGETGVGKELFARALHLASTRSDKTFLPFNCGTVPRDLIDSQLFGHRRGSFTGAHADSPGVIRSAAGGTLFLDEIGEMSIETQPKLLRFLEAGEILPLGETKPQTVDVRIVAATNASLDQMVAEGKFREDLYYRLNVIRINIPPLRERREEIPVLVEHFLERFGRELQKPMLRVADETLEYLVLHRWPGNVRQLANELRRMVALAEPHSVLMPAHLSDDIVATRRTIPVGNPPRGFSEVITRIDQPLSAAVEHIERAAIQRALSMTDGNLVEAAKMLGLSRKGLYLKRQRLKIN